MKKSVKKLFSALLITTVTLIAGFGITMLSFNLFDSLTANEMKILFTADVLLLSAAAAGVWFFSESKKCKTRRKKEFEKRRRERIEKREKNLDEINSIINFSNFAA